MDRRRTESCIKIGKHNLHNKTNRKQWAKKKTKKHKGSGTYIDVNAYSIQNRYNIEEAVSAPKQGQKFPNKISKLHMRTELAKTVLLQKDYSTQLFKKPHKRIEGKPNLPKNINVNIYDIKHRR